MEDSSHPSSPQIKSSDDREYLFKTARKALESNECTKDDFYHAMLLCRNHITNNDSLVHTTDQILRISEEAKQFRLLLFDTLKKNKPNEATFCYFPLTFCRETPVHLRKHYFRCFFCSVLEIQFSKETFIDQLPEMFGVTTSKMEDHLVFLVMTFETCYNFLIAYTNWARHSDWNNKIPVKSS